MAKYKFTWMLSDSKNAVHLFGEFVREYLTKEIKEQKKSLPANEDSLTIMVICGFCRLAKSMISIPL